MPIPFTCPHCGRFTEVADQYAGRSGPCAQCGQTIVIPGEPAPGTPPLHTQVPRGPESNRFNTVLIVAAALCVMCVCGGGVLVALLLPAVQAAREAARRMQCSNNLKQIGLALHNYHDVYMSFPAGLVQDDTGKPMHSWRVTLLPFLERADLYDQYNFDEPWDSPANLAVAQQMPELFRCPSAPNSPPGSNLSHYVVVLSDTLPESSADSLFGANRWTKIGDIADGTSNTIMVVEVRDPVPWTQPDTDLHFGMMDFQVDGGPQSIGSFHPGGAMVLFADGSVQFLSQDLDSQKLRLLVQPADGDPVQRDF